MPSDTPMTENQIQNETLMAILYRRDGPLRPPGSSDSCLLDVLDGVSPKGRGCVIN